MGQLVLSSKHSNTTSSDNLQFNEDFYKAFDLISSEVVVSDELPDDMSNLLIRLGPLHVEETDDGDVYYIDYFDLIDTTNEVVFHIEEENKTPLYLTPQFYAIYKQMREKPIPFSKLDDEDDLPLFDIEVKTKAITHNYQMITSILDSNDHLGCKDDLDAICNKMGEVMLDAGINYNFVHHEMILRGLLRRKSDETRIPDFGPNGNHSDYKIMRLTSALSTNPSPLIRFSTGWLKKNLMSTSFYKVNSNSHLDPMFVSNLKDYIDEA